MIRPEQTEKNLDYSSGEWLATLTIYKTGDHVTYPAEHGAKVLTITRIWPVSPGDYKFARHTQYVELSDQHGIVEYSISAASIAPAEKPAAT